MKAREIRRTYLAVCKGQLPAEVGIINAPIARKADSAIERCVDFSNGESAVTHYRVRYYQNGYSLVELHLEMDAPSNRIPHGILEIHFRGIIFTVRITLKSHALPCFLPKARFIIRLPEQMILHRFPRIWQHFFSK